MHRRPYKFLVCSLLAVALLVATSQYLAHFHIPQAPAVGQPHAAIAHGGDLGDASQAHSALEHCTLCLQFDRLPAPPAPMSSPVAHFLHIATVEAERLERLALDHPQLWPPSRGPPSLTC
jgi:hypothetical protein